MEDFGMIIFCMLLSGVMGVIIGLSWREEDYNSKLCKYKNGTYVNHICVSEQNYIDLSE